MKKAISLILVLVLCLSLCACGGGEQNATEPSQEATESPNESVVGSWYWVNTDEVGPANGVTHMELYEGGTGKGTNSSMTDDSHYPITWEVKDGIVNVSASNAPTIGLKVTDDALVAVDGSCSYKKLESLSAEELQIASTKVSPADMNNDYLSNSAKARQTYCGKPILLKAKVWIVEENHAIFECASGSVYLDAYLPSESLAQLESEKWYSIVGIVSDIQDISTNWGGVTVTYPHYIMDTAFMAIDTFDWVAAKEKFLNNNCDFIDANIDQFTQLSGEEITDVIVGTWTNNGNTLVFGADGTLTYSDGSSETWSIKEFSDGSRLHTWTDWKIYHLMENIYYMKNLTTGGVIIKAE